MMMMMMMMMIKFTHIYTIHYLYRYSPKLKEFLSSPHVQYLPFGDHYFMHPSIGIAADPLLQYRNDPAHYSDGQKLLRRLGTIYDL
jgi:hypothetical protein